MNATTAKLIPRSVLFGNPERQQPQISPDGLGLAYLAPLEGVMNLWVEALDGSGRRAVTTDRGRGIPVYGWAAGGRFLVYLQDRDGDENWHLFRVDPAGGETVDLTPFENVSVRVSGRSKELVDIVGVMINRDNPALHDMYRLNVATGELELAAKNPGNVVGWYTDWDLRVRMAEAALPEGGTELLVRDSEDAEWRSLLTWSPEDQLNSHPLPFTADRMAIYAIDARNSNTGRLVSIRLDTGAVTELWSDPRYDVADALLDEDTHELQMVAVQRARLEWHVMDESIRADIDVIRGLHHGDFDVLGRDDAQKLWVIGFTSDSGPIAYYLYDRSTRTGRMLFTSRPELSQYACSAMEPFSFRSRDGLEIHGYLTFPLGVGRRGLPMVLNVHGGPWTRDVWRFHPEAQWLANRGYLCMQVNYRGSAGYGKDFLNAGNREWGGRMHDDLVDAVQWAVSSGIADPERVAIYGGSYGGYAALIGATFTPDLFTCAVAIVGPSNLITFIQTIPAYWTPLIEMFHRRVGNPDTEPEFLMSRSPLSRVDEIRVPMLIAQGANDPRVKQSESEQIVQAMREQGIEHEYLLFPDEGHGFARPENREKFYAAAEVFLARHLGGAAEGRSNGHDG